MTRRHVFAVVIALLAMVAALVPPLWVRYTGDDLRLAIRPVDPLSFFRGNYVDLTYDVDIDARTIADDGDAVYVVFDDARPAQALRATASRPDLGAGETCLRGRVSWDRVDFPELEQFFVTAERGAELEGRLSRMVAVLKVTPSCRGVLVDLEPRE